MKKQKIAVIGHPLGHTMSPFIHKSLFELSRIEPVYSILDIVDLPGAIVELRKLDAFNITIPYKQTIIPYLDEMDEKAERFGSVNTVKVQNGKMKGYTTDGAGCMKALEKAGADTGGSILILGTGGAARAIAFEFALTRPQANLTLACRPSSRQKADALAEALRAAGQANTGQKICIISYDSLEDNLSEADSLKAAVQYDIIINATNVGMYPHADACPVSNAVLGRCKVAFDAVYNPLETKMLKQAKKSWGSDSGGHGYAGLPGSGGTRNLVFCVVQGRRCGAYYPVCRAGNEQDF